MHPFQPKLRYKLVRILGPSIALYLHHCEHPLPHHPALRHQPGERPQVQGRLRCHVTGLNDTYNERAERVRIQEHVRPTPYHCCFTYLRGRCVRG